MTATPNGGSMFSVGKMEMFLVFSTFSVGCMKIFLVIFIFPVFSSFLRIIFPVFNLLLKAQIPVFSFFSQKSYRSSWRFCSCLLYLSGDCVKKSIPFSYQLIL
jgi:hypothetical protein